MATNDELQAEEGLRPDKELQPKEPEIRPELSLEQREIDLKLKELQLKIDESKSGFFHSSPLVLALVAILGTVGGAVIQGYWNTGLEQQKFESSLISKSLETTDPKDAANKLGFLVDVGLVRNLDGAKIRERASNLGTLPVQSVQSIRLTSPTSFAILDVKITNGAGEVPVSGTSEKIYGSNYRIYVCTLEDDKNWWFNKPITPDADGTWSTNVYPGSEHHPVTEAGKTISIQAVVATDEEVQAEISKHGGERYFEDVTKFKIRSTLVSGVVIKANAKTAVTIGGW